MALLRRYCGCVWRIPLCCVWSRTETRPSRS